MSHSTYNTYEYSCLPCCILLRYFPPSTPIWLQCIQVHVNKIKIAKPIRSNSIQFNIDSPFNSAQRHTELRRNFQWLHPSAASNPLTTLPCESASLSYFSRRNDFFSSSDNFKHLTIHSLGNLNASSSCFLHLLRFSFFGIYGFFVVRK